LEEKVPAIGTVESSMPAAKKRAVLSRRRSGSSTRNSAAMTRRAKIHNPAGNRGARTFSASAGIGVHWPRREKRARRGRMAAKRAGSVPGSMYNPEPATPKPPAL
jgi:hypothetical protein